MEEGVKDDKHLLRLAKKSMPYVKSLAQKTFNEFIRNEDKDRPCISCEKPLGEVFHAGHYFSVGAHPSVRFNEDNCHGQCVRCNHFLGGNLANYKENLIKKIGMDRFIALEALSNDTVQRKKLDYIYKILEYKNKNKLRA